MSCQCDEVCNVIVPVPGAVIFYCPRCRTARVVDKAELEKLEQINTVEQIDSAHAP
jgi:hypothetical protein